MSEMCVHCGRSVKIGSGNYVNRIPVLDDIYVKQGMYDFPEGEYCCAGCDARITYEEKTFQ